MEGIDRSADFNGKTALVTGGTRGIGRAISLALLRRGCKVSVDFRSNTSAAIAFKELANEMGKENSEDFVVIQSDVSDFDQSKALIDTTIRTFGHLDILVNNAGIARDRTLRKMNHDEWSDVMKNDLSSVYCCTSNVINHMIERRCGRILSISSVVALMGNFGQTNYAAAKAGIIGFTKSLAIEVAGKGITVNAIAPGFTDTDMMQEIPADVRASIVERIPMKRLARPEEVAELAVYILSEGASYLTGQVISINGGLHM